jgi:transposase
VRIIHQSFGKVMIGINPSTPIYLCTTPTDMRKSFNGLCGMVINFMGQQPQSGHLFVFVNRFCNRVKILLWDRNGFWLFYKRLEQGSFEIPAFASQPGSSLELRYDQLLAMLEGIDISSIKQRKRFC